MRSARQILALDENAYADEAADTLYDILDAQLCSGQFTAADALLAELAQSDADDRLLIDALTYTMPYRHKLGRRGDVIAALRHRAIGAYDEDELLAAIKHNT